MDKAVGIINSDSPLTIFITLVCKKCSRRLDVKKDELDYPEAVELHVTCPKCDDGDFDEPLYYDADGKHIIRDPNEPLEKSS